MGMQRSRHRNAHIARAEAQHSIVTNRRYAKGPSGLYADADTDGTDAGAGAGAGADSDSKCPTQSARCMLPVLIVPRVLIGR